MRDRRPNILIAVLDSARPELLSCYGGPPVSTPNIDRLAAQGYLFEKAIAPSVWTFPVMASVFTGMLPAKHGGHDQHALLDSPYSTLAEFFASHGYETAAVSDVPYVGPMTRLDRGFRWMSNLQRHEVSLGSLALKAIGRAHRTLARAYTKTAETRVLMREAVRWLDRIRDPDRPFLLYIHSDETHAPLAPPARYRRRYAGISTRRMRAINQDKQLYMGGAVQMSAQDFCDLYNLALAEAAYFDMWFGRLLRHLQRYDVLNNTVIVVMADHGENFGEHGLVRHGLCLYDTLLHVPLIIRPPGGCNGARVKPMVQLIDLLPTLLNMASIDVPGMAAEFQGRDLLERVQTGEFPAFTVSELYRPATRLFEKKVPHFMPEFRRRYDRVLRSYRTATHKYIWSSNGRHELYDLVRDPDEARNLIEVEPELAQTLHQRLQEWLDSFPHAHAAPSAPLAAAATEDGQLAARLRDLGYVE